MKYHLTPVTMPIIKKTTNNKCEGGRREKGILVQCWQECTLVQALWKTVGRFLKKLEVELSYDPAISFLGIYTKKTKTLIRKDICTHMFIAALFTIAKIWKQPKCPSMNELIKKNVVSIDNRILFGLKEKEGNHVICNNMDEPGERYAK